jgi:beta-lactamase regulating signal transducer with metallopeptidase domain
MLAHLVDVSIRSLVLALPAAIVLWIAGRNRTAALRHAIWTAVLCGMLALFAFGRALPTFPVRILDPPPASASTGERVLPPVMFEETSEAAPLAAPAPKIPRSPVDRSAVVTYVYGAIALAFLTRFVTGMFLIRKLRASAVPISCTGTNRQYESDRVTVPVTMGWLRPCILLPLDWRDWPPDKLDAVLAHEGAHVRRHDGLIAALAHVNRCIFWFHPLAWMLEHRLALLAEQACDESAVATLGDCNRYAHFLLEMASLVDGFQGRMRYHDGRKLSHPAAHRSGSSGGTSVLAGAEPDGLDGSSAVRNPHRVVRGGGGVGSPTSITADRNTTLDRSRASVVRAKVSEAGVSALAGNACAGPVRACEPARTERRFASLHKCVHTAGGSGCADRSFRLALASRSRSWAV